MKTVSQRGGRGEGDLCKIQNLSPILCFSIFSPILPPVSLYEDPIFVFFLICMNVCHFLNFRLDPKLIATLRLKGPVCKI